MDRIDVLGPLRLLAITILLTHALATVRGDESHRPSIATFSSDVTIPIGHRCMGVLKAKSTQIDDPLQAHGLVLWGASPETDPIVVLALDWCEVRNGAYDQWRDALAEAARTSRQRVLVCSLHQHDAPVTDNGAQEYLDEVGLEGELFDVDFQNRCIRETVAAMQAAMSQAQPLTHVGTGEARVEKVASNRRVVQPDGSIRFDRYSRMDGDSYQALAEEGEIDPMLKSITFFSGEKAIAAISCYATHPMSHYGKGAVSADFVGMARRRRQLDTPDVKQIYVSGCSGDVTAGKYNDGAAEMRATLGDRLYRAMKQAAEATVRYAIVQPEFRCESFHLPFHDGESFSRVSMLEVLHDDEASVEDRITAAMGLSSRDRHEREQPIDLPCIDLGKARIVLLPGESFVRYQRMAQQLRPNSFVMAIGYGECWPGYIPTEQAFDEGFGHGWRWVDRGCEAIIRRTLDRALR